MSLEEYLEAAIRRAVREEVLRALSESPRRAEDRRVTRTEAAAAAGVSPATIKSWEMTGKLQAFGKGRGVRYSLSEVLAVRPDAAANDPEQMAEEILRRKRG